MGKILISLFISLATATACFASICSEVKTIPPSSHAWMEITKFISGYTKSKTVNLRQSIEKNGWYVVEYDSDDFEPVIKVLQKSSKGFAVKAGWGGMPEEGDSINDYLAEHAAGVPSILIKCFSPKGEPFITEPTSK